MIAALLFFIGVLLGVSFASRDSRYCVGCEIEINQLGE
jgi:hypothetical protein